MLVCAGNGDDYDNVENDDVFPIPDAVFDSAGGCHTAGVPVSGGEFIILRFDGCVSIHTYVHNIHTNLCSAKVVKRI